MIRQAVIGVLALVGACAPRSRASDSTSALTVDTVKPLTTGQSAVGASAGGAAQPATKVGSSTVTNKTASTKQRTDTSAHLGRDSAFRRDPRDPRHQLKTVPKPPQ